MLYNRFKYKRTYVHHSMLRNLHSYVEIVVKFILIFEVTSNEQRDDYMIFEDLEDTGIKNFLEAYESTSSINTSYGVTEQNVRKSAKQTEQANEYAGYSTMYFDKGLHGKNITNKSYDDIIREEPYIQFQFRYVPFFRETFEKIYKSKVKRCETFTNEEISSIFFYFSTYDAWNPVLIWIVCFHLQTNPSFVQQLHEIVYSSDTSCNQKMKCLSTIITGEDKYAKIFMEMVNSNIKFILEEEESQNTEVTRRKTHHGINYYNIKLEELNIAFLIGRLSMSYNYFASNCDLLHKKFSDVIIKSSLEIRIFDIHDNNDETDFDSVSEAKVMGNKLNVISQSKFLKNNCIRDIILLFSNVHVPLERGVLDNIDKLSTVICKFVSIGFIRSIPERFKNFEVTLKEKTFGNILGIPRAVKKASFVESRFKKNITFPDHMRFVTIFKSKVDPGVVLTFDESCEDVQINETGARVFFKELTTLNYILLNDTENWVKNGLIYFKRNELKKGCFKTYNAKIDGKLCLSKNFLNVEFISIDMSPDSEVLLCDENRHFSIAYSSGTFNLTPFIGICLNFSRRMRIETTPIKGSPDNMLILTIGDMKITENMELSNCFEDVKLENVIMKNNTKLVLNSRCKMLTIKNFHGIISIGNVERFEMIKIYFPVDEQINFSFDSPVHTAKLYLYNACKEVSNIKSVLSNFRDIKHLKFENKSNTCFDIDESVHVNTLKSIPSYQITAKECVKTWSEGFASKAKSRENLFYAVSNIVVDLIIEFLLNELKLELFENIELVSLTFAENNYKYLAKLKCLQILDVSFTNFSDILFSYLPPSLKLLNISQSNNYYCKSNDMRYDLMHLTNLTKCCTIRVLIINADLFFKVGTLSFIPPSVRVLKLYFECMIEESVQAGDQKLHLRELYIEGPKLFGDDYCRTLNPNKTLPFLNCIMNYIEFNLLERIVIISSGVMVQMNPNTLEIIETRTGSFFERVGPIYDEVDL